MQAVQQQMTTADYANLRNITPRAVTKAIKLKHALPGVVEIKKWGRAYMLTIDRKKLSENIK